MACFQGPQTIKALEERFKLNLNEDDAIKFAEGLGTENTLFYCLFTFPLATHSLIVLIFLYIVPLVLTRFCSLINTKVMESLENWRTDAYDNYQYYTQQIK